MRIILVTAMSLGGLLAVTSGANAYTKHRRHTHYYSSTSELEARKARNEWNYNHGGYYEHYSPALRVGSRAWFEQQDRERGER